MQCPALCSWLGVKSEEGQVGLKSARLCVPLGIVWLGFIVKTEPGLEEL